MPFLKYKRLKLKLRVFLAGHSVAMVTYCVTKITPTCSPVTGQFFDTMIVASIEKSHNYDPTISVSWKVLETVLSHLEKIQISRHMTIYGQNLGGLNAKTMNAFATKKRQIRIKSKL